MSSASNSIRQTTQHWRKGSTLMDAPRPSQTNLAELLEWRESGNLVLSPKFQRRPVWKLAQKSYFIDTMLQEMPSPQIYLRTIYDLKKAKSIHEVIDGQQRLRTVLAFYDGEFAIASQLESDYSGQRFKDLTKTQKLTILKYKFNCESFEGISDREVHDIFRRMNTFSTPLNAQELRHGRWFGHFSRTCEQLAGDYLDFWRANRILTETKIARMAEVQLTAALLIQEIDGMQDLNKKSINHFYRTLDKRFPNKSRCENRFQSTINEIIETLGDELNASQFRNPAFFYTLFGVVYHRMFGMPNVRLGTPKKSLTDSGREKLRSAVQLLSRVITTARQEQQVSTGRTGRSRRTKIPVRYRDFAAAATSQSDNIAPRKTRFETLYRQAFR